MAYRYTSRKLRAWCRLIRRRTRHLRRVCVAILSIVLVASRIVEIAVNLFGRLLT